MSAETSTTVASTASAAPTGQTGPAVDLDGIRRDAAARATEQARVAQLAELGLDSDDARKAYEAWRKDRAAQEPEIKRARAEWAKAEGDYKARLGAAEKQLEDLAAAYMETRLRGHASEIARGIDAHDTAVDDIYRTLHAQVIATGEDDAKALQFVDGDLKIDLDEKDALRKISQHIAKTRPHYVRSRLAGGAGMGGAASVSAPASGEAQPKNAAELAKAMVLKLYGGGRTA